jgi:hypothetical protein
MVARIVEVLGAATHDGDELRAALRGYSGMAEAVTREWLLRRSLDRRQARILLTATLLALVHDVVPALRAPVAPS